MRFWRTCRSGTHIVGMYGKILTRILRIDVDMTSLRLVSQCVWLVPMYEAMCM